MVSPDGRQAMLDHAEQFAEAGIPFVFDPGQGLPMFGAPELERFVELAEVVAVNDYEGKVLAQRTGLSLDELAARVRALVVTRGGEGSVIYADGRRHEIPAAPVAEVVDPTGCGDAYRAGLLYGLLRDADWPTTGRIAPLVRRGITALSTSLISSFFSTRERVRSTVPTRVRRLRNTVPRSRLDVEPAINPTSTRRPRRASAG